MYVEAEQRDWDTLLPFVTFAFNTAKQDTTGFSPFFLLHGREAETTMDTLFPYIPDEVRSDYVGDLVTRAEEARQVARQRTVEAQNKDRQRYDAKHRQVVYHPGQLVWIFTPVRKVGLSEKLMKRYFGPYRVLRRTSEVNYEVEDYDPLSRRRKIKDVVHVLRMKPYNDPDDQLEQDTIDNSIINSEGAEMEPEQASPTTKPLPYSGPVTRSRGKTLE